MSSKPTRILDWTNDDDSGKFTVPDSPTQLAGHSDEQNADPKMFNWFWWRISQWIEYLDELELNQIPDSSDYKKVKTESLTSNEVDHTKILNKGSNTHSDIDTHIVSSTAHGVTGDIVGDDDTQELMNKTIDADYNTLSNLEHGAEVDNPSNGVHGVTGNVVGHTDTQELTNKTIDGDENTISNLVHGSEVDNPSLGVHGVTSNIVGKDDTQTLTNKTIDADNNTISNLAHGSEVDDPTTGVHGVGAGDVVGTALTQTLTNKTLTSPKINEDVTLTSTSSEIDAAVSGINDAITGDGTSGIIMQKYRITLTHNNDSTILFACAANGSGSWNSYYTGSYGSTISDGGGWVGTTQKYNLSTSSFKFTVNYNVLAILSISFVKNDSNATGIDNSFGEYATDNDYIEIKPYAGENLLEWVESPSAGALTSVNDDIVLDIVALVYE